MGTEQLPAPAFSDRTAGEAGGASGAKALPEEGAVSRAPPPKKTGGEPSETMDLLKPPRGGEDPASPASTMASEGDAEESASESQDLSLRCGAHQIPHPAKVSYGGEDAFFVSAAPCAVGVADGVSEWGWRFGMNPRDFSSQLMEGARAAVGRLGAGGAAGPREVAARAMQEGHSGVKSFGASTAIVAVLDPAKSSLGVANLGDSGLRQFRRAPGASAVHLVGKTEEQQHQFNQPFQLSCIPTAADFPGLVAQGKTALVEAVRRSKKVKQDQPGDARLYDFAVQEGDLLVIASDGVFDNLDDDELCDILSKGVSDGALPRERGSSLPGMTGPEALALAIAQAAFSKSQDPSADTPFGRKVKQAGFRSPGGVPDDITVVVAWVVGQLGTAA